MDNIQVNHSSFNTGAQQSIEGESHAQATTFQHSQFGGGAVTVMSASLFEEAAMNIASTKKLETDEQKDKEELSKLINKSRAKVPDIPEAEKLGQCLQKMKEALKQGELSEEEIKEFLQEYSGDSTHQFVAVEDLIVYLQNSGSEEDQVLAEQLQVYNKAFYETHRQDIQAGLNVSEAAAEFSAMSSMDIAQLRGVWRDSLSVPELTQPIDAYKFALSKVGDDYGKVSEGMQWMQEALARELNLAESERSCSKTQMVHVRSQLEYVYGVRTVVEACKNVENKLPRLIQDERQG